MKIGSSFLVLTANVALASSAWAYRTAEDLPDFDTSGPVNWAGGVVEYVINEREAEGITVDELRGAAADAFSTWASPVCVDLTFAYRGVSLILAAPGDGTNSIQWVLRERDDDLLSAELPAITDVQYILDASGGWRIEEADLYLDAANHDWSINGERDGTQSLKAVLVHEAGHMLGLLHPCEIDGDDGAPRCDDADANAEAVMNPLYSSEKTELTLDDVAGVCYLYAAEDCKHTGCAEGEACVDGVCQERCGDEVCSPGSECVEGQCIEPTSECDLFDCEERECTTSGDCPDGETCDAGSCRPGGGETGDPCEKSSVCLDRTCSPTGYCTTPCERDVDCPDDSICDDGACEVQKLPLGAPCEESDDCLGEQCLAGLTDEPVCTRRCGEDYAACPDDWRCDQVEGRLVCVPPEPLRAASGQACAVGRRSAEEGTPRLLWVVLGMGVVWRRRGLRVRRDRRGNRYLQPRERVEE